MTIDPDQVARALDGSDAAIASDDAPPAGQGPADPMDDFGPSELAGEDASVDADVVRRCAAFDHSDTDNARRLLAHFGADLVVVAQEGVAGGDWASWSGTHWDLAGGAAGAARIAQRLGGRIALEAACLEHTPQEAEARSAARGFSRDDKSEAASSARAAARDAEKALKARRTARWRFAVTSKNVGRMRATLEAAAPHVRRPSEDFNADPHLVACATHTLRFVEAGADPDTDGRTLLWRIDACQGHRREDLITACVPYAWTAAPANAAALDLAGLDALPATLSPKWTAFLTRLLPDKHVRRTVRAYCGASLLNVPLQRIMFHYGAGANGKSVFLETLTRVLGESFAIGLPPESIAGEGQRGAGAASPDIARLFGKRMVRVLEMPEGKPLHEDLVKRLTGGEKFPVRSLFKGYFEFVNRAKPHMSGNGFPTIDGTDHGIWRRMLVVHWGVTIPEGERREFEEVVSEFVAEGEGILVWLAAGALDFLQGGLPIAPAIFAATEQYRRDMDPIGEFLTACVREEAGGAVQARSMHRAYVAWSEANARRAKSETKFGKELSKRLTREARKGVNYYLDVILHDVPTPPPPDAPPIGDDW